MIFYDAIVDNHIKKFRALGESEKHPSVGFRL
jgi:hypothetical protein